MGIWHPGRVILIYIWELDKYCCKFLVCLSVCEGRLVIVWSEETGFL